MELIVEKTGSGARWVIRKTEEEIAWQAETKAEQDVHSEGGDDGPYAGTVPWLLAVQEVGWWKRLRKNPKRLGEVSQAAFLWKARAMGFGVALPWGDSERYDFMVWARDGGPIWRVQVKGTGRPCGGGYEVQPVHTTRRKGKKRYTAREIDVLAAHVQPLDVWYLLPIRAIRRERSLMFYPDALNGCGRWEQYREGWEILGQR